MTKRAHKKFKRSHRDFYRTPEKPLRPLLPYLNPDELYYEPCCGTKDLSNHLRAYNYIISGESDIITGLDAFDITPETVRYSSSFITNPPWSREILHPLIIHLSNILSTWLLFDADWMHLVSAKPYMKRCQMIISVGRVCWFPETKTSGYDNCCWYYFTNQETDGTRFIERS